MSGVCGAASVNSPGQSAAAAGPGPAASGASLGGTLGSVASINGQSHVEYRQTLANASNHDLMQLASNGGIDRHKRAQALSELLDRLSTGPQASNNSHNVAKHDDDDDDDDDMDPFIKKLKKLLKDMRKGKMDAEDRATLAQLSSLPHANDTTPGGLRAHDIR